MARTLMTSLSEDFRLDEQHDHYRTALDDVVTAKLAGQEPPHAPATPVGPVVDLMAMLQESVRAAQGTRSSKKRRSPDPGRKSG